MINAIDLQQIKNTSPADLNKAINDLIGLLGNQDESEWRHFENQVILLKSDLEKLEENRALNLISYNEESRGRSRILKALLDLLNKILDNSMDSSIVKSRNLTPNAGLEEPPRFIGLEKLLPELHKKLCDARRPVVLWGVPGSGKTTWAQAYRARFGEEYQHHAWIEFSNSLADSLVRYEQDFLKSRVGYDKKELRLQERFLKIVDHLKKLGTNNLLIIDHMDKGLRSDEGSILTLLCQNFGWKVLITSQGQFEEFDHYQIPQPGPEMALGIYQLYRGEESASLEDESETVQRLLNFVDYHPLVIELIAKTINNSTRLTPESVLKQLEEKGLKGLAKRITSDYLSNIFDFGLLNQTQKDLLIQIATIGVLPLDFDYLTFMLGYEGKEEQQDLLDAQLVQLIKQGWLKRQGKSFLMINIIRQVALIQFSPDETNCQPLLNSLGTHLYKIFDQNSAAWYEYRHLYLFIKELEKNLKVENIAYARLLDNLLWIGFNWDNGNPYLIEYGLKDVAIHERVCPPDDIELAEAYNNLSLVYQNLGKIEEAFTCQNKSLNIRKNSGQQSLHAESLMHLALLYAGEHEFHDLKMAKKLARKSIKINESLNPSGNLTLAYGYANLADILNQSGEEDQYEKLMRKSLELTERFHKKPHPDLIWAYHELAQILSRKKNYELSEEYWKKSIKIAQEAYPEMHVNLAALYYGYADFLVEFKLPSAFQLLERFNILDIAFSFGKEALDIYHRSTEDENLINLYLFLSKILIELGDFDNAAEFIKNTRAIIVAKSPDDEQTRQNIQLINYFSNTVKTYSSIAREWISESKFIQAIESGIEKGSLIGQQYHFHIPTNERKGDRYLLKNYLLSIPNDELLKEEEKKSYSILGHWYLNEQMDKLFLIYDDKFQIEFNIIELSEQNLTLKIIAYSNVGTQKQGGIHDTDSK